MSDENENVITPVENAPKEQDQSQLPDWARKAISEANSEAAKYRLKANTAAEEAKKAVEAEFSAQIKALSDEKSAITAERSNAVGMVDKLTAALEAGVPGETAVEFAGLLQGSNKDEYKAHAEKLKSMFGAGGRVKAVDPSSGLPGGVDNTPENEFMRIIQSKLTKK